MISPTTNHQPPTTLIMGTRGSPLALAQSRQFACALETAHPGLKVEEKIIRTTGDKRSEASLPAIGGKGVFTLEIENALLDGSIHFAVHSLKDLPPDLPEGLTLGCIPQRESAADVLILRRDVSTHTVEQWPFLPHGAKIGTSSLRRKAQLLNLRPDLQIEEIRGNIDTRLRKLDEHFDAIVLAKAGLNRLGLWDEVASRAHDLGNDFLPAPGQGALAIEVCKNCDAAELLRVLDCQSTRREIEAERSLLKNLNAGCSTPLGAIADVSENFIKLRAVVLSPDGKNRIEASASGALNESEKLGAVVAQKLLEQGAARLLSTHE
jgi:hydroxymethylbilane synthase